MLFSILPGHDGLLSDHVVYGYSSLLLSLAIDNDYFADDICVEDIPDSHLVKGGSKLLALEFCIKEGIDLQLLDTLLLLDEEVDLLGLVHLLLK